MKAIFKALLIFIFLGSSSFVSAKNYYVSITGNDQNKGISATQAWKSIERLNQQKLAPGDSVLFQSGGVFYGEITMANSGTGVKPIVFSSYGSGNKPVITGAKTISGWKKDKNNIYVTSSNDTIFCLFVNNKRQTLARFPNSGFLTVTESKNSNNLYDADITQPEGYWNGAVARIRQIDWEYRHSKVVAYNNGLFVLEDSGAYSIGTGFGYYIDNHLAALDSVSEWYYNTDKKLLYFYPSGNELNTSATTGSIEKTAFTLAKGISNISIENLVVEKFEKYGILGQGNNSKIMVKNCVFENITVTAVHLDYYSTYCEVSECRFTDILGRGVFALEAENMLINDNYFFRIGLVPGHGISGVNGMEAINVSNVEEDKKPESHRATKNIVKYNYIDSVGFIGIRMDGSHSHCEYNFVNNSVIHLNDGAGIYCYATGLNYTFSNSFSNNIVCNVKGSIESAYYNQTHAHGIYIDNNSYDILVENNTVFNIADCGFVVNFGAFNTRLTGNTIFNCRNGILISEDAISDTSAHFYVDNNTFFQIDRLQRAVNITNFYNYGVPHIFIFNNNKYYSPVEKYNFIEDYIVADKEQRVQKSYTIGDWRKYFKQDANSTMTGYDSYLNKFSNYTILYNAEKQPVKKQLTNRQYYDLEGKEMPSEVTLPSFGSKIIVWK